MDKNSYIYNSNLKYQSGKISLKELIDLIGWIQDKQGNRRVTIEKKLLHNR